MKKLKNLKAGKAVNPFLMKRIITLVIIFVTNVVYSQSTVSYTISGAEIANPGRGFYSHRETYANSNGDMNEELAASDINNLRAAKNITLIFRLYYLGQFKSSGISAIF